MYRAFVMKGGKKAFDRWYPNFYEAYCAAKQRNTSSVSCVGVFNELGNSIWVKYGQD